MTFLKLFNSLLSRVILVIIISGTSADLYSQVNGCNDPTANNYNPLATVNDGSCTYNLTSYIPPVLADPISATLIESSGLQMAGNFLWSFNDGGGAAAIYRIDTLSDAILQTVNLSGAVNVDWEDIAFDGTYFYVGDFGNNANGARTDLKIYKFPLSAIPDYIADPIATIPSAQIEVINFTYSDQLTPIVTTGANNTKYDCEAMIVDGGAIHLFTKNWIDVTSTHYLINSISAGTYIAEPLETLATGYLVTGADKSPGKQMVALLGYQTAGLGNHFIHLLSDYSSGKYFNGNKRRIDLPDATIMGQAEGITFRNTTYGYISNEKLVRTVGPVSVTVNQKLRSFDINNFIPVNVLPLELRDFTAIATNGQDKISWQFYAQVQKLTVEQSIDGINFTVIKAYDKSVNNSLYYKPANASVSYYRISWYTNNGQVQFSKIISVRNDHDNTLSNFLLKKNGELTFILNGAAQKICSFKLVGANGQILSQVKETSCFPGVNNIHFFTNNNFNENVYLNIWCDIYKKSILLHVE